MKQIVMMVLVVNDVGFAAQHPELRAFVLDRDRTGTPGNVQIYLALYLGPIVRYLGVQGRANLDTNEAFVISEVAYPPFSYIASFDEPSQLLPRGNITGFSEIRYTTRATAKIDMIVGFGHTPLPADFRTAARVERDRAENAVDAYRTIRGARCTERGKRVTTLPSKAESMVRRASCPPPTRRP